jgi:hypothetical protein
MVRSILIPEPRRKDETEPVLRPNRCSYLLSVVLREATSR